MSKEPNRQIIKPMPNRQSILKAKDLLVEYVMYHSEAPNRAILQVMQQIDDRNPLSEIVIAAVALAIEVYDRFGVNDQFTLAATVKTLLAAEELLVDHDILRDDYKIVAMFIEYFLTKMVKVDIYQTKEQNTLVML